MKKYGLILFGISILGLFGSENAQSKKQLGVCEKEECKQNSECLCFCSRSCSFRKKRAEDYPVYVENDPRGIYCYCKPSDVDMYPRCARIRRKRK